jgi:predicted RNA-binding protein
MSQSPDDEPIDAEVVEEASVDQTNAVAVPEPPTAPAMDYTESGVPTFDYVRSQIEGRIGTSLGAAELAAESAPAVSLEEHFAERAQAAKDRLEEIRRMMREEGQEFG